MCVHYVNLSILFSVNLQQTSPFPVCPGDNVTFTCTVISYPFLIWFDPNDDQQQVTYTLTDTENKTETFGEFTIKLIELDDMNLVSTATLTANISHDDGHKEILCGYGDIRENGKIELSGKLSQAT